MAKAARLAPEQLLALDRLKKLPGIDRFYLAGASAIAWHLGHRRSRDLDFFSLDGRVSLLSLQRAARKVEGLLVVSASDVALTFELGEVPVDLVRYPYPLLRAAQRGPRGYPVAGLEDLAAMKLSAISRRGIKRDFWDLYEIVRAGISLPQAADIYRARFNRGEADLYPVQRSLTWFEDAEADPNTPEGLTAAKWKRIKQFFIRAAPELLLRR